MKKILLLYIFSIDILFAQYASLEATLSLATFNDITIPYQNGIVFPSFEKQNRTSISLGGQWKKLRFNANHDVTLAKRDSAGYLNLINEANGINNPNFNDGAWENHLIPSTENKINEYEKVPEYYENGVWYRTKFSISDSLKNSFSKLIFYSLNYVGDFWLNGKYLGYHEGGYTSFAFDVSKALRFDSANVLVVRVDNIPWGKRKDIVPFYKSDWFNYTGIIHDVYLEFSNKISVSRTDVVTKNIDGTIQSTIVINNKKSSSENVEVSVKIFNAKSDSISLRKEITAELIGSEAQTQGIVLQNISIPADTISVLRNEIKILDPKLWSPLKPNLYILKVTISQNGKILDEFFTQFGVRTIKQVDYRILLNEKPIYLHGVARHEDHPNYGRSLPKNIIFSDLQKVKYVNANYLRTGHYPNHPYTYLVADRLGIVVMEEIPVWWFNDAIDWLIQNNVRRIHYQMFREMVFRDFNRPSIALWSTNNECKEIPNRQIYNQTLNDELDYLYPDGRLTMQSAAADYPGPGDVTQSVCDVAGWTMYYGIFYDPYKFGIVRNTKYFLVDAHDYFPKKPIIDTEFGFWSTEKMTEFAKQVMIFDSTFLAFAERIPIDQDGKYNPKGFLAATTWWCIFDWYSHQQNNGFQSMGLIRMNRNDEKPVMNTLKKKYATFVLKSEYLTSVEKKNLKNIPKSFRLMQNYPNPFNPSTKINFEVPIKSNVSIKIFDVLGKEVLSLVNEVKEPGNYEVDFSPKNFSNGIYFYKFDAGSFIETKKMILLK